MNTIFSKTFGTVRDKIRDTTADRGQHLAVAAVAMVGFGLAGVSAATAGDQQPDGAATPPAAVTMQAADGSPDKPNDGENQDKPKDGQEPDKPKDNAKPAWVMPGAETTSTFGPRWGTMHAGIDFAQPENAPIQAVGAGTIFGEGWLYDGYGISVVIDHGDGTFTHYAHLNKTAVKVGQKVAAGGLIGYEGSTGNSTGPHLHFEVHKGMWNQIDPAPWLKDRGVDLK